MPVAAIIGGGVIGAAWASRFLLHGWNVCFYDPAPHSEPVLRAVLDKARHWVPEIYDQLPPEGSLTVCGSIAEAVVDAEWVQESTPERLEIKQSVLRDIQAACSEAAIVASSDFRIYAVGITGGCCAARANFGRATPITPCTCCRLWSAWPSARVPPWRRLSVQS